jgi:hypothetical protein
MLAHLLATAAAAAAASIIESPSREIIKFVRARLRSLPAPTI